MPGYVFIPEKTTVFAYQNPWLTVFTYRREICVAGFTCMGCGRPRTVMAGKVFKALTLLLYPTGIMTSHALNKRRDLSIPAS